MSDQIRRLYRSNNNRVLGGVCGGIGEYLNADPVLIRVCWIAMTLAGGLGVLLYVLALFIVPSDPRSEATAAAPARPGTARLVAGIALIVLGGVILLDNLDLFPFHHFWRYGWDLVLPSALILGGLYLIARKKVPPAMERGPSALPSEGSSTASPTDTVQRRLKRSVKDRKLLGVCGGLAEFFGIDSSVVRIACVLFTVFSGGAGVFLYLILALVVPDEQPRSAMKA